MDVEVLRAKAEQAIRMLTVKVSELDNQKQLILAEICRLQGEVRAYNKMMEPEDTTEGDRQGKNADKEKAVKL